MADQGQAGKLQVRLVTPDRELVDTAADSVELPGRTGYLEVLYGAAPLLTELGTGLVTIHGGGGGNDRYYVAWGFAEVLPNRVTILAESAEKPEEIDATAAQREYERGQKIWDQAGENPAQYERANELMHDAQARMDAKGGVR
ncbi:MAG: F-type H+-transporting ATPase subunit epsilon [Acidobacteriaceae bacterium]|jgi:F-type H+-transporting ATPase subunit epsilon|nr:F-type H+-transporting ATPase subunit epsilon [Acidobacteriaceae bacterium]